MSLMIILLSITFDRFRTLLEELQGNVAALAERISTVKEFLPPRMVVDVRCYWQ